MKKQFLIATSLFLLALPQAHAFADDDARRAILELRVQLQQASENRIDMMNRIQKLEEMVSQLQDQLQSMNGGQQTLGSEVPQVGNIEEQNAYNRAYNTYLQKDFAQSTKEFLAFTQQYPKSALKNDATFFYGSSLYANKQYKEAITILENLVITHPNFSKSPDSLLVIYASNQKINHLKEARAALNRILDQYPDSQAAEIARKKLR